MRDLDEYVPGQGRGYIWAVVFLCLVWWAGHSFFVGPVPVVTDLYFGRFSYRFHTVTELPKDWHIALPIGVSRWWDIAVAFFLSLVVVEKTEEEKGDLLLRFFLLLFAWFLAVLLSCLNTPKAVSLMMIFGLMLTVTNGSVVGMFWLFGAVLYFGSAYLPFFLIANSLSWLVKKL